MVSWVFPKLPKAITKKWLLLRVGNCVDSAFSHIITPYTKLKKNRRWTVCYAPVKPSWNAPTMENNCIQISLCNSSKCMHDMNQTEAEYPRHSKRSQRASLSSISPVGRHTRPPTPTSHMTKIGFASITSIASTSVSCFRRSASVAQPPPELVIVSMAWSKMTQCRSSFFA